jgi:hypothetical protein
VAARVGSFGAGNSTAGVTEGDDEPA